MDEAKAEPEPTIGSDRVRCMFCYEESGDTSKATFEHLLSKPVANAFGIERDSDVLRADADLSEIRWSRLNGIKRKCVCDRCNNGWMNQLEHAMVSIAGWLDGSPAEPLGSERDLVLRRWALKTHFLLHFIEGNASRFLEDPTGSVVPPFTAARRMYEGDDGFVRSECGVGLSLESDRRGSAGAFAWAFGHATVSRAPAPGIANFAPVTIVRIGTLRLWVITPLAYLPESVAVPEGVRSCEPGLRPSQLSAITTEFSPTSVTITYP